MRLGQVGGPHRGSEAVGRVVGDRHRFLGAVEADHREHRAKDFLLGDLHRIVDAIEDGRLDVQPAGVLQRTLAADQHLRTRFTAGVDIAEHGVELLGVYQRADVGRRVQRVARLPALECLHHHGQEALLHRPLYQQPRAGGADLALIEGDGTRRRLGSGLQVGRIGEDDVRTLAARLQPDALHVRFTGVDHQLLGYPRGAGEDQRVDVHVQRQRLADGVAVARQDVEHAGRNAGIDRQLGNADGGQR